MATLVEPNRDSEEMVGNEVVVGSDLNFQRKWWAFEKSVWIFFLLVVVAALLGLLGRGALAKASERAPDGSINVEYERFARYSTPSALRVQFQPSAIREGRVQLWLSEDLLKTLGNQRVIPQPLESVLDHGGMLYTFPAVNTPATVEFALQPARPGVNHLTLRVPGSREVNLRIMVWP